MARSIDSDERLIADAKKEQSAKLARLYRTCATSAQCTCELGRHPDAKNPDCPKAAWESAALMAERFIKEGQPIEINAEHSGAY